MKTARTHSIGEMARWIVSIVIVFLTIPSTAQALTASEAQTLPLKELASRILGESGRTAIAVDRPDWPPPFFAYPPNYHRPSGPPPLRSLAFHMRPVSAAPIELGWTGLCSSAVIPVNFDDQGRVTSTGKYDLYGAKVPLMKAGDRSLDRNTERAREKQADEDCSTIIDVHHFFQSPNEIVAQRASIAVQLLADSLKAGGKADFRFECRDMAARDCSSEPQALGRIDVTKITQVQIVDCGQEREALFSNGLNPHICYGIDLNRTNSNMDYLKVELSVPLERVTVVHAALSTSVMLIH